MTLLDEGSYTLVGAVEFLILWPGGIRGGPPERRIEAIAGQIDDSLRMLRGVSHALAERFDCLAADFDFAAIARASEERISI